MTKRSLRPVLTILVATSVACSLACQAPATAQKNNEKQVPKAKIPKPVVAPDKLEVTEHTDQVLNATGFIVTGCLPATDEWRINVLAGQHFEITATRDTSCDPKGGWSHTSTGPFYGPEGLNPPQYVTGTLSEMLPLGSLIAGVSTVGPFSQGNAALAMRAYFPPLYVGAHRIDSAAINGVLHLGMNDQMPWNNNSGSLKVTVFVF